MSDNDNYLSDDEENTTLIQDERLFPPSESDEEYDSEYEEEKREYERIINEKILNKININENNYNLKEELLVEDDSPTKPKKQQRKKIFLNLKDEDKKWKSKRMNDRKGPIIEKRKFNPRLPPPGNKFKLKQKEKNNIKEFNENDFPSL